MNFEFQGPLDISLKSFILDGDFGGLRVGTTKSWLQNNFMEPDDFLGESLESAVIWRYGNIELHFIDDSLWMIFSDYIDTINGGEKIRLSKWILGSRKKTKLVDWARILNSEGKGFQVVQAPDLRQTRLQLDHGTTLTFADMSGHSKNPNDYSLAALHLAQPNT